MIHTCKSCGKCCKELITYINHDDVMNLIESEDFEILSCLTWYYIKERDIQDILFIPKKKHVKDHSYLKKFYKPEFDNDESCIFLNNNKCCIHKKTFIACKNFPKGKTNFACPGIEFQSDKDKEYEKLLSKERRRQNITIAKNKLVIIKAVNQAKEMANESKLRRLIWGITLGEGGQNDDKKKD